MIATIVVCLAGVLPQEGPLGSAAFQPTSKEANSALLAGDSLLAEAVPDTPPHRAFDAWRRALLVSDSGAGVTARGAGLPDSESERITFGVEEAVLRRIEALPLEQRTLWSARFEPLAAEALSNLPVGQSARALGIIERNHPGTQSAARAAIILGDQSAEQGAHQHARLWWQRADRHAHLCSPPGTAKTLKAAVQRRRNSLTQKPPDKAQPTLFGAKGLKSVRTDPIERLTISAHSLERVPLGRGLRLGAVQFRDGSALVQGPRMGLFYGPGGLDGTGQPVRIFLKTWTPTSSVELRPLAAPSAGGWSLLPASDGDRAALVIDRGEPGRKIRGLDRSPRGNCLAVVQRTLTGAPKVVWTRRGQLLEGPGAATGAPKMGTILEYQPGPLILGQKLFVMARTMGLTGASDQKVGAQKGDLTLLTFDMASGELLGSLLITQASDLARESRLMGYTPELRSVCMPLALAGETIICGTNAGLVAAISLDGRTLWTLRTRRRQADSPGWPGSRPPLITPRGVWVAPGDSDRLYHLSPRPGSSPLLAPILPLGESLDLAGIGQENLLLMGRNGPRQALIELGLSENTREPLLHLGPQERFTGTALHSPDRTLFATNHRLYLLDRKREMLLLDAPALVGQDRGGDLVGLGQHVLLLGANTGRVLRVLR